MLRGPPSPGCERGDCTAPSWQSGSVTGSSRDIPTWCWSHLGLTRLGHRRRNFIRELTAWRLAASRVPPCRVTDRHWRPGPPPGTSFAAFTESPMQSRHSQMLRPGYAGGLERLMAQKLAAMVFAAALALATNAKPVMAFPSIFSSWSGTYPSSASGTNASCALCHDTKSGPNVGWNAYGNLI